ncbi:MAG: PT domain-containing protein [Kofleriaceae bacterium]|nr:PT domain-containing protein [Kofleriaceae bacterium]
MNDKLSADSSTTQELSQDALGTASEEDVADRKRSRGAQGTAWVLQRILGGESSAPQELKAVAMTLTNPGSTLVRRDCTGAAQHGYQPPLQGWPQGFVPPEGLYAQEANGAISFIATNGVFYQLIATAFAEAGVVYSQNEHQAFANVMVNRLNAKNREDPGHFRSAGDPATTHIGGALTPEEYARYRDPQGEWNQVARKSSAGLFRDTDPDWGRYLSAFWGTVRALVGNVDVSGGALSWGPTQSQNGGGTVTAAHADTTFYAEAPQTTTNQPTNQPTNRPTNQQSEEPTQQNVSTQSEGTTRGGPPGQLTGGSSRLYDVATSKLLSSQYAPAGNGGDGVYARQDGADYYVGTVDHFQRLVAMIYSEGGYTASTINADANAALVECLYNKDGGAGGEAWIDTGLKRSHAHNKKTADYTSALAWVDGSATVPANVQIRFGAAVQGVLMAVRPGTDGAQVDEFAGGATFWDAHRYIVKNSSDPGAYNNNKAKKQAKFKADFIEKHQREPTAEDWKAFTHTDNFYLTSGIKDTVTQPGTTLYHSVDYSGTGAISYKFEVVKYAGASILLKEVK